MFEKKWNLFSVQYFRLIICVRLFDVFFFLLFLSYEGVVMKIVNKYYISIDIGVKMRNKVRESLEYVNGNCINVCLK